MKLYKLTKQDISTYGGFTFELGKKHIKKKIKNPELCSSDVFHAYGDINLAFLLNPIHADIKNPRLFEAKGKVVVRDFGKVGCFDFKLVREIKYPKWVGSDIDTKVRLYFALLCAKEVLPIFEKEFPNDKRPRKAIEAAQKVLENDTEENRQAAAWAAEAAGAAADAADAAWAAGAAARAAEWTAWEARATWAAAWAVGAAWAAGAAAKAAGAEKINFSEIAKKAIKLATKKRRERCKCQKSIK